MDEPKVNTAQHEQAISEGAKDMVGGLLSIATAQLNSTLKRLSDAGDIDPLQLERYIHNADKLINMADVAWELGEKAYSKSNQLYLDHKKAETR